MREPTAAARLLDPGCGAGEFIEGAILACQANGWPLPRIVGVELGPDRAATARIVFITREKFLDVATAGPVTLNLAI